MKTEQQPTDEYKEAYMETLSNTELVKQFDRLKNKELGKLLVHMRLNSDLYKLMKKSGEAQKLLNEFQEFFDEFIWSRMNKPKYPQF